MISPVKIWRNQKHAARLLGQIGTVVSFTTIRVPPQGFEGQVPYSVVLVKIDKQVYIGQLVDHLGKIKVGQKVEAVLRRVQQPDSEGVIPYGIKFKLIT